LERVSGSFQSVRKINGDNIEAISRGNEPTGRRRKRAEGRLRPPHLGERGIPEQRDEGEVDVHALHASQRLRRR
jgi:hypothetical protein